MVTSITKKIARRIEDLSKGIIPKNAGADNRGGVVALRPPRVRDEVKAPVVVSGRRHWCTVREGDWTCSVCSKSNFVEFTSCVICGRDKAQPREHAPKQQESASDAHLAYTDTERKKNAERDRLQDEYRNFVQTKLRLDK